ncbi:MAG: EAL domain-containing protein [Rhodospirillaceae bacterium]|nr:EAL domain-containing protein [Rhodospirillaceae bacterium]
MTQHDALFQAVLDATSDAVMVTDRLGVIQRANPAFAKLTGHEVGRLEGMNARELFAEHNDTAFCDALWTQTQRQHYDSVRSKHADGKAQLHSLTMTPVLDGTGVPSQYVALILSETFQSDATMGATRKVGHDPLTGLPDRSLLADRVEQNILTAKRANKSIAMLVMGIDRFTVINEGLGYAAGDQLLKELGERLSKVVRQSDTAARLDGDKFAVMTPISAIDDSVIVAEKVLNGMRKAFRLKDEDIFATLSVGLSIFPTDGKDFDELLKGSLSAMSFAKQAGGDQYRFFASDMNTKAKNRLELEKRIRGALANNEFVLFYQPKVNPKTNQVKGGEALIRWMDPKRGMIGPGEFIPVAEETGLIVDIGTWVMREACRQTKAWQDKGYEPIKMSVNVSAHQFRAKDLLDKVVANLSACGLDAKWLELEITESMLMNDIDAAIARMQKVRDLGCGLSIDDFGTGYSSLSYLGRFPITTLKIDRAFVRDVQDNQNTAEIARAIIGLSRGLNLEVVAEGAEILEHVDFLRDNGCDSIQGYYYSKPLSAVDFEKMLTKISA